MPEAVANATQNVQNSTEKWFDEFVSTLRVHQLQLEENVAGEDIRGFYSMMIEGDMNQITHHSKLMAQSYFVKKIILDYLKIVFELKPKKLAFYHTDSEVLVWAEIEDNNERLEDALIMAEAKINATYHEYGFDMCSTILEESDELSIPNHYKVFIGE